MFFFSNKISEFIKKLLISMQCSELQTIPFPHFNATKWSKITEILKVFSSCQITTYSSFETHLLNLYNLSHESQCLAFKTLSMFFLKNPPIIKDFFTKTLPFIANLALEMPQLFPEPMFLLLQNQSREIQLNKRQVACFIVHMFFGTFSKIEENENTHDLVNFQFILENDYPITLQKLFFIFNYFSRLESNQIDFSLTVSYIRIMNKEKSFENWLGSEANLLEVKVFDEGGIDDFYENSIQVDFANKYIGGGSLYTGCVQEEIRFIISPECLPSMVMFESLKKNEAAYIIGAEQFSKYKGYAWDLEFAGDFHDKKPSVDSEKRMDVNILALDAIFFKGVGVKSEQYSEANLLRELNKAFIGFRGDEKLLKFDKHKKWIATGRWGCGAFNGISQLKFMIQWIAAAESGKNMMFYRKGDVVLYYAEEVVEALKGKRVGDVIRTIHRFSQNEEKDLFKFILKEYLNLEVMEGQHLAAKCGKFDTLTKILKN